MFALRTGHHLSIPKGGKAGDVVSLRRFGLLTITRRNPKRPSFGDRVERQFTAKYPDRLWVADITQHKTDEGWLYLAVILDAYSRKVIGWSMADHLRAELVIDALNRAIKNRQPPHNLIHHSDHGSQYTSLAFGQRLEQADL